MREPENILIIRFSSLGDVLLVRPVLMAFREKYPHIKATFLTRKNFLQYFQDIAGLSLPEIDLEKDYSGAMGIWKLSRRLKKDRFDLVLDLHNVTRSRLLDFFLNLTSFRINKGRRDKKNLTRKNNKILKKLPSTMERYSGVFARAGLPLDFNPDLAVKMGKPFRLEKIGIAPLSRHRLKEWPLPHFIEFLEKIKNKYSCQFYLLGSTLEKENLKDSFKNIISEPVHSCPELEFIRSLDLVITMDSANLHLAGILGVPTVSFWGPTHPYAGFGPVGNFHLVVQKNDLNCRPCSIYGNKPCFRKDHACMVDLNPQYAWEEFEDFIAKLKS